MKTYIYAIFLGMSTAVFAQNPKNVDFKTLDAKLYFDYEKKQISGSVFYTFDITDSKPDTIYIDAQNINFDVVKVNGKKRTGWLATNKLLKIYKGYKKGTNKLEITYNTHPKQTLYFVQDGDNHQIWTQGQGKYTSHWLPSFDDVNEKLIFSITASYNKDYTLLSNGILKDTLTSGAKKTWIYKMDKPMSSYLAMLAIGKFSKRNIKVKGATPVEVYLRTKDTAKFNPTYKYTAETFETLEKLTGVSYPWGVYRQVPVVDFLYAGMENTTSTVFSQDYVVDQVGFNDRTYLNVNAHELAHQWFGDLVTEASGVHHWLQEGFATYYALLVERSLFGEDHFNNELYEMAERLQQASKTDNVPILNEKASTLSFYQKGAWALHIIHEGIGEELFNEAVKNYLQKYAYKNVDTDQFLAEIKAVAPQYDVADFKKRWLESANFQVDEAIGVLSKNAFIQEYLELGSLQEKPFPDKKDRFLKLMQSPDVYFPLKEEILFQTAAVPFSEKELLVKAALNTQNIKVRQAVARTLTVFPESFFENYRSLLSDDSYITREIALNVLFKKFPAKQTELLDQTQKWYGFNDMNLRLLWLTLAYSSKDYHPELKEEFYGELIHYASPKFDSDIRQNALANLLYIGKTDPIIWQDLANALTHHKWQFVKFAKDNLRKLLKKKGYRELMEGIVPSLNETERSKFQLLLDEQQAPK